MKTIAFIPARSGSKRLKNKNIRIIKKRPLIYWTVRKAIKSKKFDLIIFSSDSKKYWSILKRFLILDNLFSKKIIFDNRNKKQSNSKMKIFDYIKFYLIEKKKINKDDLIVQLLPTAPLRDLNTISKAIELAKKTNKNIFSVNKYDFHVSFALSLSKNNNWKSLFKNSPLVTGKTQSQDQKEFLKPNPVVNCLWVKRINKKMKSIYINALAIKTGYIESFDIDDENDFLIVKSIMESKRTSL